MYIHKDSQIYIETFRQTEKIHEKKCIYKFKKGIFPPALKYEIELTIYSKDFNYNKVKFTQTRK